MESLARDFPRFDAEGERVLSECHREESEVEIDVTPEMIKAGVSAMLSYDERFYSWEEGAKSIFKAMMLAKKAARRVDAVISESERQTAPM